MVEKFLSRKLGKLLIGAVIGFLTGLVVNTTSWLKGYEAGYGEAMADILFNVITAETYFSIKRPKQ